MDDSGDGDDESEDNATDICSNIFDGNEPTTKIINLIFTMSLFGIIL